MDCAPHSQQAGLPAYSFDVSEEVGNFIEDIFREPLKKLAKKTGAFNGIGAD